MKIIFLGPPGAGKGTHAKLLSERFHIPHISTGDLLREAAQNGSPLSQTVRDYVQKGKLVPDDIVLQLIAKRFHHEDTKSGFILDGFPRNKSQAESLDEVLKDEGDAVETVIYLKTSETTILDRLTGRRVCESCGANYHLKNIPPKEEGRCDACQGKLFQREDDQKETIKKRIQVYQQETAPLIDYYKTQNKLKVVSGDLELEEGQVALSELLGQRS